MDSTTATILLSAAGALILTCFATIGYLFKDRIKLRNVMDTQDTEHRKKILSMEFINRDDCKTCKNSIEESVKDIYKEMSLLKVGQADIARHLESLQVLVETSTGAMQHVIELLVDKLLPAE